MLTPRLLGSRNGTSTPKDAEEIPLGDLPRSDLPPTKSTLIHQTTELNTLQLIFLTVGAAGLQMAWGIETAYGSPFLQSLGISKSVLSLVWIAGPLTGVIVPPVVGLLCDSWRTRWGRRRPFILISAVVTVLLLLALAWSTGTVLYATSFITASDDVLVHSSNVRTITAVYAIILVYALDFSINSLQACLRVFLVDGAPKHQQDLANAWMGRIANLGHIACYYFGQINLPELVNSTYYSQFQLLCVLGSILILVSSGVSVFMTEERFSQSHQGLEKEDDQAQEDESGEMIQKPKYYRLGFLARMYVVCEDTFLQIIGTAYNLPVTVRAVCRIQFFAWLGWFPYLFYATTYIGNLYVDPILKGNPDATVEQVEEAWLQGTRIGSSALLAGAFVSFFISMVLPFFVKPLSSQPIQLARPGPGFGRLIYRITTRENGHPRHVTTLAHAWLWSHLAYAALAWSTLFITSPIAGGAIVTLMGIPWAVTQWAPFSFVGADVARSMALQSSTGKYSQLETNPNERPALGTSTSSSTDVQSTPPPSMEAGLIFGIFNVFISAPQIVSSLLCSLVFTFIQRPRNMPGDDSVGWALRFAGLAALYAAYLTRKLSSDLR